MKKLFLLISGLLILIAVPATIFLVSKSQDVRKKAAPATTLALSPDKVTKKVGDTFTLEAVIDTAENQVVAAEIHLKFDATKVEAQTISNGPLFPNILSSGVVDKGTASITVGAASSTKPIKGNGTAIIVKFKALETTDAPIIISFGPNTFVGVQAEGATNALVGSSPATVTITSTNNSVTSTPTPTPIAQITNTLTPTATPKVTTGTPTPTQGGVTTTLTPTPTTAGVGGGLPIPLSIKTPLNNTRFSTKTPTFTGLAAPSTAVTVTIYSTPITMIVTSDSSGNWSYTPQAALEDGAHTITASITDAISGETQTATANFVISNATTNTTTNPVPVTGSTETTYIIIGIALLFLCTGILAPFTHRA